jgi:hypothetical protein
MTQAFSKLTLNAFIAAVSIITCSAAHAAAPVIDDQWERPIARSQMNIVEAQNDMADVRQVELLVTRKNGAAGVTGFTLRMDRQMINFEVSKIRRETCGAELYIGMTSTDAPEHSYRLVVVDHSHETCTPASQGSLHALPVTSTLEALLLDRNQPVLRMAGEPEPVVTAQ